MSWRLWINFKVSKINSLRDVKLWLFFSPNVKIENFWRKQIVKGKSQTAIHTCGLINLKAKMCVREMVSAVYWSNKSLHSEMCTKLILYHTRQYVLNKRDSVGQTNILNTLIVITIFELEVRERENEKIFLRHNFYFCLESREHYYNYYYYSTVRCP